MAAELFRKMQDACLRLLAARGVDPECGRRLADQLRAHGLTEVEAEGRVFVWRGGSVHLTQELLRSFATRQPPPKADR